MATTGYRRLYIQEDEVQGQGVEEERVRVMWRRAADTALVPEVNLGLCGVGETQSGGTEASGFIRG